MILDSNRIHPKVGSVFPMVIWSEFRVGQYKDDNHREDVDKIRILKA